MRFLFGILLLALGIGIGPLMAQNQKASDKASETGMIIPAGTIMPYAGSTAPAGWVFAAGQEYNTTGTYAKLYAAIGTTYCTNDHGPGGTCTTGLFRVPDLRGRFIGGKDNMNGIAASRITVAKTLDGTILGKAGGEQTYTPQGAIPGHYHGHDLSITSSGSGAVSGTVGGSDGTHTHTMEALGSPSSIVESFLNSYNTYSSGPANWRAVSAWNNSTSHTHSIYTNNSGHGHSFSLTAPNHTHANGNFSGTIGLTSGSGGCNGNSGATCLLTGTEGNNLSPTVILNYIIKI